MPFKIVLAKWWKDMQGAFTVSILLQHYCYLADGCFWSDVPNPDLISNIDESYDI